MLSCSAGHYICSNVLSDSLVIHSVGAGVTTVILCRDFLDNPGLLLSSDLSPHVPKFDPTH